jgi:hypothetical protein
MCRILCVYHVRYRVWNSKGGYTNSPKIQQILQNSRHQGGDVQQVPNGGPTNIKHHLTKFSRNVCLECRFVHSCPNGLYPEPDKCNIIIVLRRNTSVNELGP